MLLLVVAAGLLQSVAAVPFLPSAAGSMLMLPRVVDLGADPGGLGEDRASEADECVVRAILKRRGSCCCCVVLLCCCCCCCDCCGDWPVAAPDGNESLKLEGVGAAVDAAALLAPPPLPPLPKVNGEVGVLM